MVTKRIWYSGPSKVKRVAWGYTLQVDGKQARCFREDWTKDDAERAEAARRLGVADPTAPAVPAVAPAGITLAQAVDRYLAANAQAVAAH